MLEWLKNILGEAYTDEVDAKVSAEIGKNFVSKADFNRVNTAKKKAEDDVKARDQQLEDLKKSTGDAAALQEQVTTLQNQNAEDDVKARDQQLEDLKKSTGDAAALQELITTLQNQNAEAKKNYEAELARVRLDGAVEAALTAAGAKNNIAVKALLADFLKDAKLDDSGAVKGLTAEIEKLANADATAFLFNTADGNAQQQFKGMQPGAAGGKTPPPAGKEPKDMNYDELCAYLEANPGAKLE